jgi:hypothetical protein
LIGRWPSLFIQRLRRELKPSARHHYQRRPKFVFEDVLSLLVHSLAGRSLDKRPSLLPHQRLLFLGLSSNHTW